MLQRWSFHLRGWPPVNDAAGGIWYPGMPGGEPQLRLDTLFQAKHQVFGALQISNVFELFRTFITACSACFEIKHS